MTFEKNPDRAKVLIEGTEYIRAELEEAARREMITKLEDFLRRRSKISLVVKKEDLKKSTGLKEACKIFLEVKQIKMERIFLDS